MTGPLLLSIGAVFTLSSWICMAKAFDSVPRYHLLLRLGIHGDLLNWFHLPETESGYQWSDI